MEDSNLIILCRICVCRTHKTHAFHHNAAWRDVGQCRQSSKSNRLLFATTPFWSSLTDSSRLRIKTTAHLRTKLHIPIFVRENVVPLLVELHYPAHTSRIKCASDSENFANVMSHVPCCFTALMWRDKDSDGLPINVTGQIQFQDPMWWFLQFWWGISIWCFAVMGLTKD